MRIQNFSKTALVIAMFAGAASIHAQVATGPGATASPTGTALSERTAMQIGIINDELVSIQKQSSADRKMAASGIAAVMATQQSLPSVGVGENALGLGVGVYAGQAALGVSYARGMLLNMGATSKGVSVPSLAILSAGLAMTSSGQPAARAGIAFKW